MLEIIILIIVFWAISNIGKKGKQESIQKRPAANRPEPQKQRPTYRRSTPNKPLKSRIEKVKPTAIPNQPRKAEKQIVKQSARDVCHYEAAYSKGRPERVGLRGDYETTAPAGTERIKCAYCGAENFVPAGSRQHYHCYFCWEKL